MSDRPTGPFSLELPSSAESVGTARLFVASLGRALGFGEDRIDDLRLAISEAVSAAVRRGEGAPIAVRGEITQSGLELRIAPVHRDSLSDDLIDVESILTSLFEASRHEDETIVIPVEGG